MQPRHRVSRNALELIKRFEGYRQAAAQLPDGRWTIGYGHTLTARQGAVVSSDDAEALLTYDLLAVTKALSEAVFTPLTQNQFDALAAFVFNIGIDNFQQSGVLKRLNEGALIQAACTMELWRKASVGGERIVVDALVRRRAAEKILFLTPLGAEWVPAPSQLLPPIFDTGENAVVPAQAPVEVTTTLEGERLVILRDGEPAPAPIAPEEDGVSEGPARAAAAAVSARLATLFQTPPEAAEVQPRPHPERIPLHPAPQADFAPPQEPGRIEDPVPFFLRAPEPGDEPLDDHDDPWIGRDDTELEGPRSADLFRDSAYDDHRGEEGARYGADLRYRHSRRLGDDAVPYDFDPPMVQPLPERPQGGVLTLVALAVLGLVFFGGGIFWATYARAVSGSHILGPRMVGGLAGVAGVGFFVVAVYLLLDRLGRAAERQARERY